MEVFMGKIIQLFKGEGEGKMPNIFDVANYFISKSRNKLENPMTPLKLQKLCYYAQAWSLVWDKKELFSDDFQAWVHGPANYKIYKKYDYVTKDGIIKKVDHGFRIEIFTKEQIETLEEIWTAYGKYSGDYLEQLTHQERPWKETRGNLPPGMGCDRIITKKLMKEFYSKLNG